MRHRIIMDWRLFVSTFGLIFVAELGDKTQLAALSLASGSSSRWTVFLGASLALTASCALAVLGGEAISRFVSPVWIRRIAGLIFVVFGILMLWSAHPDVPSDANDVRPPSPSSPQRSAPEGPAAK